MEEFEYGKNPTKGQIEFLYSFMEKHPEFASLNKKQRMWERLKNELNSRGCCFKTKNQWKRIWTHKKSIIRRKAMLYMKRIKKNPKETTPKFTLTEKRIMKVIGLGQLSEVCPTLDSRPRFYFKKKEDQLQNSGSKISISGSLLPTLIKMEIDYELPIVDGAVKSEPVSSVDYPILTDFEQKPLVDGACISEPVSSRSVTTSENSPEWILPLCESIICENALENEIIIKQEPDENLYEPSSSSTVALENQIIIKQEPPDDNLSEPSSPSALELLQPVIVSVAPVLTTGEPPVPAIKVAVAGSTRSNEPQFPVIGSPAPSPSKEVSLSYSLLNTAQETKSEAHVLEPNSDNLVTTTEEPQLEECNDNINPGLLLKV